MIEMNYSKYISILYGGYRPPTAVATLYRPVGGVSPPTAGWRGVVVAGGWVAGGWVAGFIQREWTRLLSVQELSVVLVLVCVRLLLLFVFYASQP